MHEEEQNCTDSKCFGKVMLMAPGCDSVSLRMDSDGFILFDKGSSVCYLPKQKVLTI